MCNTMVPMGYIIYECSVAVWFSVTDKAKLVNNFNKSNVTVK